MFKKIAVLFLVLATVFVLAARNPGAWDTIRRMNLGQFAATTSAQLLAVLSDESGTGVILGGTSPTIATPTITGDITGDGSYFTQLQNISDISGPSYHFSGTSQYIEIADSAVYETTTNDFSISLHIKPNNVTDTGKRLVSKTDGTTGFEIVINEDDLQVALLDNANDVTLTNLATAIFAADTWIKIDITFDRDGNTQAYAGGKAVGTPVSATATATIANASVMRLGTETGGTTNEFSGEIDQFRYHNHLLSATDVMQRSNPLFAEDFKYIGASQTAVEEDDMADDDTGNWSNIDSTLAFDTDHYEITYVAATQHTYNPASFTTGKKYRASIDVKDGTLASVGGDLRIANNTFTIVEFTGFTTTASWQTITVEGVALSDTTRINIASNMSGAGNIEIRNYTLHQIGAVLQLEQSGVKAGTWVDSSGNDLHGALSGVVPINLKKGENQLLSITNVSFAANADTALLTVPAGYSAVLDHAKIVAGADAVSTDITIGQNTAESDFIPTNQMDNLNAADDAIIVMPIPSLTPLINKKYAAGTLLEMNVANQAGGATNTVFLYGTLY